MATETWLEKPVVAPQSRWNSTALKSPLGASAFETALFWQASEQLVNRAAKAANAVLVLISKS